MKAMYINAPGQVEIKDVEMPVRKEGEVLLKLLYACLNCREKNFSSS